MSKKTKTTNYKKYAVGLYDLLVAISIGYLVYFIFASGSVAKWIAIPAFVYLAIQTIKNFTK